MTVTAAVRADSRKSELQKRVNELDQQLLEHHRAATIQRSQWHETEARLLKQRNQALQQLSEL